MQRQIQEYKRDKTALESQVKDLRKKARYHDDHLRTIDAWWKQLIDEIKLLTQADDIDMDSPKTSSSLLFPDQEMFEKHLESRADDIRTIIGFLASKGAAAPPDVAVLQSRISQLLAAEKEHNAELEKLRTDVKDLDERLENAIMRYMLAEKKLDRAKSVTAAKLDKGLLLGGVSKNNDESGQTKREDTANGVDHGEELVELEAEVKKNQAAAEKQKEHITKLEEEHAQLTTRITELSSKAVVLTDDDYAKSELYKQLKAQHDDVVGKINHLEATNAELKEENTKLGAERTAFQTQLENESRRALSERDALVAKAEADLARIRSNRDELLADRDIKKASLDHEHEAIKKVRDLVAAQDDRIRALESENQRLAVKASDLMDSAELDSLNGEDLRTRYRELQQRYELLTGELTSMQSAFQKTSKLANQKVSDLSTLEDRVSKLAAEKSKADQKYFAAMKSKETRDGEVRTLRMQNTKSTEVVSQLKEAEAASRTLIANMEKQLAEFKSALNIRTTEHRTASQQSTTQVLEISRLSSQLTELKSQLTLKDSKLATTSSACRSAEVEVEELKVSLAETRKNLESWKSKSGQSEQYEMLRVSLIDCLYRVILTILQMIAYCNICKRRLKDSK